MTTSTLKTVSAYEVYHKGFLLGKTNDKQDIIRILREHGLDPELDTYKFRKLEYVFGHQGEVLRKSSIGTWERNAV